MCDSRAEEFPGISFPLTATLSRGGVCYSCDFDIIKINWLIEVYSPVAYIAWETGPRFLIRIEKLYVCPHGQVQSCGRSQIAY